MTYTYNIDNFLVKPVNGDQRLFIYDRNNNFVDSITTDISHYFVKNNCLIVKITNKNDLILSFINRVTAQQALEKLDVYRKFLMTYKGDIVRSERPTFNTMNRNMMCSDVTADYQLATTTPILQSPTSRVEAIINGNSHISCGIPDGIYIGCYFTSTLDNGNPAKARANDGDVQLGDQLYWIGSIAGFNLTSTDYLDFDYLI
jgi:hypothetical protein